jgi:antitoxin CcdA
MRATAARKRPTNLTLDAELVDEARTLEINVSEACERGLADEVKRARQAKWLEENRPALLAWNDWIEKNGMPYDEYRHF